MPELSIIEFAVYGLFAYSSMLVLIVSVLINPPASKVGSIVRSIYLIPGIFCSGILANTTENIHLPTIQTNSTTIAVNSSEVFTEINTQVQTIALINPVWIYVHLAISLTLTFYVIYQMLLLFGVGVNKNAPGASN